MVEFKMYRTHKEEEKGKGNNLETTKHMAKQSGI